MLGTKKRRNVSFSSNSDDIPFQNKKAAPESPFGAQVGPRAESSTAPSLDRRKAARQHVRALNTEFASWVQSQLRDHPDELWEDGVKDYLAHASETLEKFTDVVNWLETSTGSGGNGVPVLGTRNTEQKNGPEMDSSEKVVPGKNIFGMPAANASLTTSLDSGASGVSPSVHSTTMSSVPSWSFGLSANSQALSLSSSAGLTTSWKPVFSNSGSVPPVKTSSFSPSQDSGKLFNNYMGSPVTASNSMSSTSSGLFFTSSTQSLGTSPSFTSPWNAGAFTNCQTAFSFGGNQNSAPSNVNAKEDADDDNEPKQPDSPSLKTSEEKGVVVVHETKCKLYLKSTDPADEEPWKDKGTGQLYIKCEEGASKGSKESKPRILVRNDVGRIMLNASLYKGIKTILMKNAVVAIFHTTDDGAGDSGNTKAVARTFRIRIKNEEERNKLADAIREHAPAA